MKKLSPKPNGRVLSRVVVPVVATTALAASACIYPGEPYVVGEPAVEPAVEPGVDAGEEDMDAGTDGDAGVDDIDVGVPPLDDDAGEPG